MGRLDCSAPVWLCCGVGGAYTFLGLASAAILPGITGHNVARHMNMGLALRLRPNLEGGSWKNPISPSVASVATSEVPKSLVTRPIADSAQSLGHYESMGRLTLSPNSGKLNSTRLAGPALSPTCVRLVQKTESLGD